ncbi:MAG: class I SAM-dependent methyltransferase [Defluviitaleaceae bacterium]|nr:class I SAM-dependent methyltransferase [Defluviitaleaceae bacterium]
MTTYETRRQHIDLSGVSFTGRVLDIGGGGEGIMARIGGHRVVAIDKRPDELEESPDVGWKVVMDACNLGFIHNYFDQVTCFYSLMYMNADDAATALKEAYRVLKPDGALQVWDAVIPWEKAADIFVTHLTVQLPGEETVPTSYGVGWQRGQDLESVKRLGEAAGFLLEESRGSDETIFLRFVK